MIKGKKAMISIGIFILLLSGVFVASHVKDDNQVKQCIQDCSELNHYMFEYQDGLHRKEMYDYCYEVCVPEDGGRE